MIILPSQVSSITLETVHLSHSLPFLQTPYPVLETVHITLTPVQSPALGLIILETVTITHDAIDFATPTAIVVALSTLHLVHVVNAIGALELSASDELQNVIGYLYQGAPVRATPSSAVACDLKSIIDNVRAGVALPAITYDPTDPLSNLLYLIGQGSIAPYVYEDNSCYYVREGEYPYPDSSFHLDVLVSEENYGNIWRSFDLGLTWNYKAVSDFAGFQILFGGGTATWMAASASWKYRRKFLLINVNDLDVKVSYDIGESCNEYSIPYTPTRIRKYDKDTYFITTSGHPIRVSTDSFESSAAIASVTGGDTYIYNMFVSSTGRIFVDAGANGQKIYYSDSPYTTWAVSYNYTHPEGAYPGYNMISEYNGMLFLLRKWTNRVEILEGQSINITSYQIMQSTEDGDPGSWTLQADSDTFEHYVNAGFVTVQKSEICDAGENTAFIYKTCGVASPGPVGHDILKTIDGGVTWTTCHFSLYDRMYINGMCHLGNGILLISVFVKNVDLSYSSYIYRSADRGTTWTKVLTLRDYFARGSFLVMPDYNGTF